MKITVKDRKGSTLKFLLEKSTVPFANALRRAMLADVPTFAIETVTFLDNTSVLYDEMIAHRLGQVPFKTDLKGEDLLLGKKSKVDATLQKEGPGMVYSGDIVSKDSKIVPAYDNIPIVKLGEGQKLVLEAEVVLDNGASHSKFQPVSACAYKHLPDLEVLKECTGCEKCVKACPKGCLVMKYNKPALSDEDLCSMCKQCLEACGEGAIKITPRTDTFLFTVESTGAMPAEEVVDAAAEILILKAKAFEEEIGKLK